MRNAGEIIEEEIKGEGAEEKSFGKKLALIVVGAVLAMLVISFVFVAYPVGDILGGKSQSELISGNTISLGNLSIILGNGTYSELDSMYFKNRTAEISVCLIGNVEGSDYHITSLYTPTIYSQSYSEVSFEPCSADTIIMLHTHPYLHCIASDTDINTLNKTKQQNPDVLMVIMCEAKRFAIYS